MLPGIKFLVVFFRVVMQFSTKVALSITSLVTVLASTVASNKTCVRVKLAEPANDTIEVNHDGYVHVSFVLTTDKCEESPEWLRLKISTFESIPTPFCTIVFNGSSCSITDQSLACHCLMHQRQMFVSMYKKLQDLEKVIILTWTNPTVKTENTISLNVTRKEWIDSRNRTSLVNMTDTLLTETGNVISVEKFMPSLIIGSCGIVVVVVVAVVMIKRRRGGQTVETLEFNVNDEENYHYLEICDDLRGNAVKK